MRTYHTSTTLISTLVAFLSITSLLSLLALAEEASATTNTTTDTNTDTNTTTRSDNNQWSWERIVKGDKPIVANGNIYPPPPTEKWTDCLLLVTRNQVMWHCPDGNDNDNSDDPYEYRRTILFRTEGRLRGAFTAPGTDKRRLWILDSPPDYDVIIELDTVTGEIYQVLEIEGTVDGHDVVRIDNVIFMVDTRNGHIVEFDLPASAEPYTQSSIELGATLTRDEGYVNIIKRHTGYTRQDHVNNVAVHPDVLVTSLHAGRSLKTRHSALLRSHAEEEGRELNVETDGFAPVKNMGTMCHGIAFWKDDRTGDVRLISLDSKSGSMASVVVSPGENSENVVGTRHVLWEPDLNHPVLIPPEGIARKYNNGSNIFSKGLAVQNNVAFFGVSFARAPPLRATVPEMLLVAVDLITGREKWVRTVRTNGLINQILTESYLGWQVQLPADMTTIEMTYHGAGGSMVEVCDDEIDDDDEASKEICKSFEGGDNKKKCRDRNNKESMMAREVCCACGGGDVYETPFMAGALDSEIMKVDETVEATSTFVHTAECLESNGTTKSLPLQMKEKGAARELSNFEEDLKYVLKHICNLDVNPIVNKLVAMGKGEDNSLDSQFTNESQFAKGNGIITERPHVAKNIKPGTTSMQFIFSSKQVDQIFHFPWLDEWLPLLQDAILTPLNVPVNRIIRMMFANMPEESTINFHRDLNTWVQKAHRVHIPLITHDDIFFLTKVHEYDEETDEWEQRVLRIKSKAGEVYEFNNALEHAVRNLGRSRVHLIIDWMEEPIEDSIVTKVNPGDICAYPPSSQTLICAPESGEESEEKDEL
mmetsp:Transcript_25660/g.39286  ORF Transcript_25660/g.39286 Transcript_25660/m.39286 type:complete len:819 (+) Transcript_25660:194-2650(+)